MVRNEKEICSAAWAAHFTNTYKPPKHSLGSYVTIELQIWIKKYSNWLSGDHQIVEGKKSDVDGKGYSILTGDKEYKENDFFQSPWVEGRKPNPKEKTTERTLKGGRRRRRKNKSFGGKCSVLHVSCYLYKQNINFPCYHCRMDGWMAKWTWTEEWMNRRWKDGKNEQMDGQMNG